ncbi:alanine--tRNA ligase, mitochondrial-like isoform X2 [Daktulosphaira vitifoliae]|uniref:alanine--tRNA ligase, mitochondrial-like isoform X2 n=1 Tax=Daktulosphaira vitifoliae TaxID=58002 RepID=UPI0021A9DEDA|nr:alanine--tRNA ligase, mitochondrial-like isoform X2 [Daktulosphaira vitifoliae]
MIIARLNSGIVLIGKRCKHCLTSYEIRKHFIDYFVKENNHDFIKSSPVLPYNDPSLSFVNAGMCQFKNVFLGKKSINATCVANSQKCIRVGGKHNDLSTVGTDGIHHTFFEMLGNWSFGQYDKAKACRLAWNLLTSYPYCMSPDNLYVTVFNGDQQLNMEPDYESLETWKKIGIQDDHIIMNNGNENFWEMGDYGPCGPCTEIHIDYPPSGGKNLIELWNIVFIQYSREKDGFLRRLPKCFIDTGMGLERLVMVLQEKKSTYETDLFSSILDLISKENNILNYSKSFDLNHYILADHCRMITVSLADNVLPSHNHKLRRIIRKSFIMTETCFNVQPALSLILKIVDEVVENLGQTYPELKQNLQKVKHLLKYEYTIFDNLRKSIFKEWNNVVEHWPILIKFDPYEECTGFILACKYLIKHSSKIKEIPAFTLYDAFGLDIQTIKELSKTLGLPINWNEFNCQLNALRSKTKNQVYHLSKNNDLINNFPATKDHFKYDIFRHADHSYIIPTITSKLIAILDTNGNVINDSNIHKYGKNVSLVLEKTNFYCESGGQESDIGIIRTKNGTNFVVKNVNKVQENGVILHHIESDKWPILLNEKELYVVIDVDHRLGLMRSHSSVHILNSILTSYLVVTCQTSSRVKKDLMLFKFALFGQKFTEKDALIIEKKVIDVIKSSMAIKRTTIMSNDLNKLNVTVIPGEVYPDGEVYVIDIFKDQSYLSREACCGTHVENTLDLIDFCLVQCKITNNECTLLGVTGYLCLNVQSYGIALLNKIIEIEKKINIMLKSEEIASNELKIVMDEINNLKFKTKGDSKTYMPLKNQIDANKKFFSIERKIQKIMKNEKKLFKKFLKRI